MRDFLVLNSVAYVVHTGVELGFVATALAVTSIGFVLQRDWSSAGVRGRWVVGGGVIGLLRLTWRGYYGEYLK